MRSFSTLALLALPLFGSVFAEQAEQLSPSSIYSSAHEAFQDLLNALPEESLQAALSGLKDFKTGVFESHHRGVEQVHDKNPALATRLIVAAVQDLKKRQTPSNGTSPTASPPPAPTSIQQPPPESSPQQSTPPAANTPASSPPAQTPSPPADRPVIIPVQETTVNSAGQTIVQTTSILSAATASVAVVITRTNAAGSAITTTENRPAVIRTFTDAQGRVTTTTSAAQFAPTPGEVRTETDGAGRTFVTTYTPGGGTISSIKLITTTGKDGKPSVITSYEYVNPMPTPSAGQNDPSKTLGKPGLQTGAAVVNKQVAVGYALAGGALAMFV